MDWKALLISLVSLIITGLVGWGMERLVAFLNEKLDKTKYAKYLTGAVDVITRAVKTTYQTYVQSLKEQNSFGEAAQKEALSKATNMAMSQLKEDSKQWISDNFGDTNQWITSTIESVIYDLKNKGTKDDTNENS